MLALILLLCSFVLGQRAVCSNDKYNFLTRYTGPSFLMSAKVFAEPFRYSNCSPKMVDGERVSLCEAFSCQGTSLGFFVEEVDPKNEFSLRFCECGKPIPPFVPFVKPASADPNEDFDPRGSPFGSPAQTDAEIRRDEEARRKVGRLVLGACGRRPTSTWSTGCPEDERVTECVGGVWPGTKVFADLMSKSFFGSWRGRTYDCTYVGKEQFGSAFPPYSGGTLSDHADGAAWDALVSSKKPTGKALGQKIADFVCQNWDQLGVKYAIFNGQRCANGVWQPLKSGNPHLYAVHVSLMKLSAMYLSEAEMTRILRSNGLEPKYPIYEFEDQEQVVGMNDDPKFVLSVPKRTIFFTGAPVTPVINGGNGGGVNGRPRVPGTPVINGGNERPIRPSVRPRRTIR